MKKKIRFLVAIGLVSLLSATTAVQTAWAAVTSSYFYLHGQGYSISVSPDDTIISVSFESCAGDFHGPFSLGVNTGSFSFTFGGGTLRYATTVWQNNGTITEFSGRCGGGTAAPNHYRQTVSDDAAGSLILEKPKNGRVDYAAGTCSGKCSISPTIPTAAKKSLPEGVVATLYFREIDANGDPANGAYNVCFDVGELADPVIYRYVSGAWVAQPVSVVGGQVCASASSSGAWALGGG